MVVNHTNIPGRRTKIKASPYEYNQEKNQDKVSKFSMYYTKRLKKQVKVEIVVNLPCFRRRL